MTHPFSWITPSYRWPILILLLVTTILLAWKIKSQGKPLETEAVPHGILSYEFSWNAPAADKILLSWQPLRDVAKTQLLLDFGLLILYPISLSLACGMLADSPNNERAVVGAFISWAVLFAGPLDMFENLALLRMLDTGANNIFTQIAGWCAGLKFVLAYSSIGYILAEGVATWFSRN